MRAQEGQDVLEVGYGAGPGADRRRIERAAACGEEDEARETAADLEAPRADVLMRQPIAREVKDRAQQERRDPRPARGTGRGARRHVKRDDHCHRPSRRARETRSDPTPTRLAPSSPGVPADSGRRRQAALLSPGKHGTRAVVAVSLARPTHPGERCFLALTPVVMSIDVVSCT